MFAAAPGFFHGIHPNIITAVIGAGSAIFVAIIGLIGVIAKNQIDRAKSKEDAALREAQANRDALTAINVASKDLRESLTARVKTLEGRADSQWQEIQQLHAERRFCATVQAELLAVLSGYPDPPGPPMIAESVAKTIGWKQ